MSIAATTSESQSSERILLDHTLAMEVEYEAISVKKSKEIVESKGKGKGMSKGKGSGKGDSKVIAPTPAGMGDIPSGMMGGKGGPNGMSKDECKGKEKGKSKNKCNGKGKGMSISKTTFPSVTVVPSYSLSKSEVNGSQVSIRCSHRSIILS
jgi:hypothetical protein